MNARHDVKALPGETGIWVFIFADLFLFGLYFVLAAHDQAHAPEIYRRGRADLSIVLGTVNTLILLAGSWAVAMGTRVVQDPGRASRFVMLGVLSGVLFLLFKAMEWSGHLHQGHRFDENSFQTWYFFLTGFHALHVLGATLLLGAVARRLRRQPCSPLLLEAAGCYWHLVDLLWIAIFLVIYLV